jgi:replication-associated recombination protein RarA
MNHLVRIADGDARAALNGLEIAASMAISDKEENRSRITLSAIETGAAGKGPDV